MESARTAEVSTSRPLFATPSRRNEIVSLVHQIRDTFEQHFDRSWLAVVIDDLPIDRRTIREIRGFLALFDLTPESEQRIESGIEELRRYIWTLKRHLLPNVKELLGVSPLSSARLTMDKSLYVLRRLTAHALPYNLARLERLVDALDSRFKAAW